MEFCIIAEVAFMNRAPCTFVYHDIGYLEKIQREIIKRRSANVMQNKYALRDIVCTVRVVCRSIGTYSIRLANHSVHRIVSSNHTCVECLVTTRRIFLLRSFLGTSVTPSFLPSNDDVENSLYEMHPPCNFDREPLSTV